MQSSASRNVISSWSKIHAYLANFKLQVHDQCLIQVPVFRVHVQNKRSVKMLGVQVPLSGAEYRKQDLKQMARKVLNL